MRSRSRSFTGFYAHCIDHPWKINRDLSDNDKVVIETFVKMDSSSFPKNNDNDKEIQTQEKEDEVNNRGKRKDVSSTSRASSRPAKAQKDKNAHKKVMNTRSHVWNDFTRTKEDRNTCFYDYCKRSFGCDTKSGTSHLKYHLGICLELKKSVEQQAPRTTFITNTGHLAATKVSEPVFREASN